MPKRKRTRCARAPETTTGTADSTTGKSFGTTAADDRETSERALTDILPALHALADIESTKSQLHIYDPYYCRGAIRRQLANLGFPNVYNKHEDCYRVQKEGRAPPHDVLVTNPPFSADHIRRALQYAVSREAPWFMLLPTNVCLRPWFKKILVLQSLMFICPHQRYSFEMVKLTKAAGGSDAAKVYEAHVPTATMWYVGGTDLPQQQRIMAACRDSLKAATLATTVAELPRRVRKLQRFAERKAMGKRERQAKQQARQRKKDIKRERKKLSRKTKNQSKQNSKPATAQPM